MDYSLVKKDGKVSMEKSFDYLCSLLRNGVYVLSIKRKTEPRTVSQNALMWMWFKCMEDNTGTDKQDWHDYYCAKFLLRETDIGGRRFTVVGGTSILNTVQMSNFMDKVQADAAAEWGITLPLPADRYYQEFINHYRYR
ncbi:MAG: hypothetical protein IJS04_02195 [Muribaculaceae bacterium]|nr:hypothetical protein [Muribaculaceae bacterium]